MPAVGMADRMAVADTVAHRIVAVVADMSVVGVVVVVAVAVPHL